MNKKLSKLEIGAFASGDLFGGGTSVIFSFFYLIFLTDVVGMNPINAGNVFLIIKVFSFFATPLMGHITDNTRTRFGRRRPYFLAGFFGIAASFFLMWNSITTTNQWILFAYVLFANVFYSAVNAMVSVPYTALNAEISEDATERNHVTGVRMFFSQISSLICALVPLEVVKLFADQTTGYRVMGIVFGLFFAVPFLLIFFINKEAVQVTTESKKFNLKEYLKPMKIKLFRDFTIINMLTFTINAIISTILAYYMKYYLHRSDEMTYILGTMLIVQTVSIPLVIKMSDWYGKPKTFRLFSLVSIVGLVVIAIVTPSLPVWLIYVAAAIIGVGIGGLIVLMYSMYTDITDVGEFVTKERNAGTFSGVISLLRTLSNMLVSYIITLVLYFSGYAEPIKETVNGVTKNIEQTQPSSLILALKIMIYIVPIIIIVFVYFYSKKYTLDNSTLDKMRRQLKIQRGDVDEAPLTEQELAELEATII